MKSQTPNAPSYREQWKKLAIRKPTSSILYLQVLRLAARHKLTAKLFGFFALMMTLQTFAASYSVTVEGSGSYTAVGIHLNHPGGNTLNNLFGGVPGGSTILLWDCATEDFDVRQPTFVGGQWDQNLTVNPGQAVFLVNPGVTFTHTFVGAAITPTFPPPLACGCGSTVFVANQTATPASWETLVGAPPVNGSQFISWDVVIFDWVTNTFTSCAWSGGTPVAAVGEGVRVFRPCSGTPCPGAGTFSAVGFTPVTVNNCGTKTIRISGSGMPSGTTVKLKHPLYATIIATSTTSVSSGYFLDAVIDLTPATPDLWTVEVTSPGGIITTLPGTLNIISSTGCAVDVNMQMQSRVSPGRPAAGCFRYENTSCSAVSGANFSVTGIPADAVITLVTASPVATISSPLGLPQSISFTVPTLAAGQSGEFVFSLVFPSTRPSVPITGSVTAPCANSQVAQCRVVASYDPNDKFGLDGAGAGHHILGTETLPYEIHFENKPAATAPAQEVFITDHLDPAKVDLTTFSLGTVTFGTQTVVAPPGVTTWTTYLPYDVDGNPATTADDIVVKITAALETNPLDANYGRLICNLQSIDPFTGVLPTDPLRGFLPPNVTSPYGQGSLTYSVKAKTSLVTGDTFGNDAKIVFDLNPPIFTPVWVNTIDKTAPVSSVTALPALQAATSFTVDWSGSDVGSGIASYDVYVSDNNGPFTAWLSGANTTTGTYNGVGGHTYRFYSVAKDGVGHIETSPVSPDATTMVRPWLSLSRSGNNIIVTWEGAGGTLQEAGEVNGVWADIIGATSPYSCVMYPTNHFYRLRP